ncbi:FAD-dependent oxidoreductase [Rhizobium sp. AN69]|uniref:FAD-dependent oxidoreductase n=1 Tax=unclassified Rhizobium TaxID=2613769 RepID=UPI002B261A97|nr:FAD-dependent oxidoreductase [Rhizobium sp. AN69]
MADFLRRKVPGFKHAYVSDSGVQIGIRESRHIVGDHLLSQQEVVTGAKHADVIARGYFPIDIHNPNGRQGASKDGGVWNDIDDSYDIPYRCLLPKGLNGLIVAGRAISASHEAHASFRTQGGVMAIGQAAGTAAALAAKNLVSPRDVDINILKSALVADGAMLVRDTHRAAQDKQRADAAVQAALDNGSISAAYLAR